MCIYEAVAEKNVYNFGSALWLREENMWSQKMCVSSEMIAPNKTSGCAVAGCSSQFMAIMLQ